jgi:nucleoid-associated protein YgaU
MALEKAIITDTVTGLPTAVMFNPEEYTVNRDINYAQTAIPGLSAPVLQFVNGNMQTLEMELFLDTYEEHRIGNRIQNQARQDVRRVVRQITRLMDIAPATHSPPILLFTWASLSFRCVLARVSQQFTMFLPDGTPVRAKLGVTFNEFRNVDLEAKEVKRETADYSRFHVVGQGETLSSIAATLYGNPRTWRPIALRNRIDDPRGLTAGQHLVVPRLPYRDPDTGEVYQ